jgi:hypothetical protein
MVPSLLAAGPRKTTRCAGQTVQPHLSNVKPFPSKEKAKTSRILRCADRGGCRLGEGQHPEARSELFWGRAENRNSITSDGPCEPETANGLLVLDEQRTSVERHPCANEHPRQARSLSLDLDSSGCRSSGIRAVDLRVARSIGSNEYNGHKVTINCPVREHKRCSCQ